MATFRRDPKAYGYATDEERAKRSKRMRSVFRNKKSRGDLIRAIKSAHGRGVHKKEVMGCYQFNYKTGEDLGYEGMSSENMIEEGEERKLQIDTDIAIQEHIRKQTECIIQGIETDKEEVLPVMEDAPAEIDREVPKKPQYRKTEIGTFVKRENVGVRR